MRNSLEDGKGMRVRLYLLAFVMLSLATSAQTGPDDRVIPLMQQLTDAPSPSRDEGPRSGDFDAGVQRWVQIRPAME
jgi:hypothetical protein